MMSIEARAKILADRHYQPVPVNGWLEFYKTHLREVAEGAVREYIDRPSNRILDTADALRVSAEDIHDLTVKAVNRPTAEDALRAVMEVCWIELAPPDGWKRSYENLQNGCKDILAGHRDTVRAMAITGESQKV